MSEQNKIILQDLVKQVKEGTLDIEQLPDKWREHVEATLNEENEGA
jgi:hypothetical protein